MSILTGLANLSKALKLFGVAVAAALVCSTPARAASVPADYAGVQRIDLSGVWDFRLDAAAEGESGRWFAGNDASGWTKLAVPGSFNEQLAKNAEFPDPSDSMRFYKGKAWYRTSFASPPASVSHQMLCYLHLSGTLLRHTVWLNGVKLGASVLPYLDASYEASSLLKAGGPNVLVVEVDNGIEKRAIPDSYWHGWWDDGGLIRPVYLELRPPTHGQSYVTTTMQAGGAWKLVIETRLGTGAVAAATTVAYSLTDGGGKQVWQATTRPTAGSPRLAAEGVIPTALAWSPEHPTLYTLTTSISSGGGVPDVTTIHVGFRQIAVEGTRILLNGAPIAFRGVSRHQFLAGAGVSLTPAQDRADIAEIKALGANFVRLAHYSQSQDVYDACDELGVLVWNEIPAWQTAKATLADPAVWRDYAEPELEQMVQQHRNHPSVVVWSVANEIPTEAPEGAAFVAKAIALVKTLDSSRLVTFASDRREGDTGFGPVDFIAVNEYFGWYYGHQQDVGPMLDSVHRRFPGKPIVVSEFGAEALPDWQPDPAKPDARDYSESAQASFLQTHLEQIFAPERSSFVAGGLIWLFNDFPDPHQTASDRPAAAMYCNTKGLVTMNRQRKPSFAIVQTFFNRLQAASVH